MESDQETTVLLQKQACPGFLWSCYSIQKQQRGIWGDLEGTLGRVSLLNKPSSKALIDPIQYTYACSHFRVGSVVLISP